MRLNYIDLFAGCGGLSLGLHNAGWKGLFAIEKSPDAFATLKHNLIDNKKHFNWPSWLPQENLEIDKVIKNYKEQLVTLQGKVDLVAGGPPCQGFSTAGRRREDDVRNGLIKSYLKFVSLVKPKIIFFENVKGFTLKFDKNKSKGRIYSNYVVNELAKLEYNVHARLIDFSKYGVPQKRTRFILVAIQNKLVTKETNAKTFFKLLRVNKKEFLLNKNLPLRPNLGNAISDLLKGNGTVVTPERKKFLSGIYGTPKGNYQEYMRKDCDAAIPDSHSFAKHKPEIEKRFKIFLKQQDSNKKITDAIKKKYNLSKHVIIPLSKKLKAPTITTLPDDYIHYSEPRILTVREYARIQSFPDWYKFKGKYTTGGKERKVQVPRYTQIGNAIPPLFGELSGNILKDIINE